MSFRFLREEEMELIGLLRIQAQFDHLADKYFDGFDHDLGEREQGYVTAFDLDLDIFAAAVGLTKTSVEAILKDEGQLDSSDSTLPVILTHTLDRRCSGYGRFEYRYRSIRAIAEAFGSVQECQEPVQVSKTFSCPQRRFELKLSRKLTKRTEELVKDSAHLKPHVVPHMQSLSNAVQEPVNFAITVCFEFFITNRAF